jgi:ElaB/YqjD/DUF883 family membrane-anchored ribosome-binding protein
MRAVPWPLRLVTVLVCCALLIAVSGWPAGVLAGFGVGFLLSVLDIVRSAATGRSSGRPPDDTRCPACGGSAHALDAATSAKFGGRRFVHRHARKRIDEAWRHSDRLADELDNMTDGLRSVIEETGTAPAETIRRRLIELLPEAKDLTPERKQQMHASGLGHLVARREQSVKDAWRAHGGETEDPSETGPA